jgi:hypothetical protein
MCKMSAVRSVMSSALGQNLFIFKLKFKDYRKKVRKSGAR